MKDPNVIRGIKLQFSKAELEGLLREAAEDRLKRATAREAAAKRDAKEWKRMEREDPGGAGANLANNSMYQSLKTSEEGNKARARNLRTEAKRYLFQADHLIGGVTYRLLVSEVLNLIPEPKQED